MDRTQDWLNSIDRCMAVMQLPQVWHRMALGTSGKMAISTQAHVTEVKGKLLLRATKAPSQFSMFAAGVVG